MKTQRKARDLGRKYAAWLLFCLMLMPLQAIAEKAADALDCLMREASEVVSVNFEIALDDRLSIRFEGYEIGDAFEYSPAGGFSSVVLSAREGYCLLCLYVSAEIEDDGLFNTIIFQSIELLADGAAVTARGSFFQTVQEKSAQNPLQAESRTTVTGYLLFALPEDVVASCKQLTATLLYEENEYSCRLNPDGVEAMDTVEP